MADRILKSDSGNDTVIQNNSGSRKIEVTDSGDVEVTGDFKVTTVKATNLKANDGTASMEIADSSGDIGFSGNTDLKIKLPSAGGLFESDGSTEILTESSGAVSLKNTSLDSSVTFPDSLKNIPAFQVSVNSTTTVTRNSTVLVPFDNEIFDTNSAFTPTAGNYKFTVPSGFAGKYAFQVTIGGDDNGHTWDRVQVMVSFDNGSSTLILGDIDQAHTTDIALSASFVKDLSVGNTVQIYVGFYVSGTGNPEVLNSSRFSGFKIIGA